MQPTSPDSSSLASPELGRDLLENACAVAIKLEDAGDLQSAMAIYEICASLNDLTAITRLADILSEPPDFPNVERAKALYQKACIAGHAPACRNLAILFEQLGDSEKSQRYLKAAKERGDVWQVDE